MSDTLNQTASLAALAARGIATRPPGRGPEKVRRHMMDALRGSKRSTRSDRTGDSGQTLVEFALAIPIVLLVFMSVIELALGFNAFIGLNRASQQAAHTASVAGGQIGADCLILQQIEEDVTAPNRREAILQVVIQQTSLTGNFPYLENRWERNGTSTDCELPNGDPITVPYQLTVADYPESERCSALKGCGEGHSTVDNIAVGIRYRHDWITPMSAIITSLPGGTAGWTFTQRNIFRIEPTL